jgi:anti-sigma B factor antagonist
MSFTIRDTEREGVAILRLSGALTGGEATSALRDRVSTMLASGSNRIVLSMEEVEYVDSTGLGVIVVCHSTLSKAGGGLRLAALKRRNVELLVLTKLTTVFEIFEQEQDAVNSFFPGREIRRFDILSFVQQMEKEDNE